MSTRTFHFKSLRSATDIACEHVANMAQTRKKIVTRAEIIRNCKAEREKKEIILSNSFRKPANKTAFLTNPSQHIRRVTVAKKNRAGGCWKLSGIGLTRARSLEGVKKVALANGYTFVKLGAAMIDLSKETATKKK